MKKAQQILAMGLMMAGLGNVEGPIYSRPSKARSKPYKLTRAQWKKRKSKLKTQRNSRKKNRNK